jgi:phage tail sheath gpL-like
LFDGISTFYTDQGAVVRIQRMITMYQKNAANADDTAYLDLNTGLTLMYLRYSFRNHILSRYARAKLADDGTPVPAGQSIITPQIGKNEAVAWFLQMRDLGLVENLDQFKTDLICIRSTVDVNRLEWILPPDLINQFVVGAATIKFRL